MLSIPAELTCQSILDFLVCISHRQGSYFGVKLTPDCQNFCHFAVNVEAPLCGVAGEPQITSESASYSIQEYLAFL